MPRPLLLAAQQTDFSCGEPGEDRRANLRWSNLLYLRLAQQDVLGAAWIGAGLARLCRPEQPDERHPGRTRDMECPGVVGDKHPQLPHQRR